jgi:polyketide biosynthesis enoyl-CoA hydratase PksI
VNAAVRERHDGVWTLDVAGDLGIDDIPRLAQAVSAILPRARCVVLTGGPEVFNSGASAAGLADAGRPITDYVAAIPRLLLDIPVPTIAAMAGHGIGGGLLLGLWCDCVVLAADRLYGANFMALGFTPGMGATVALEDCLGALLAREMLYTGQMLTGRELRERGAPLPHVLPRGEVEARAMALAGAMAEAPGESARLLRRTLSARRRVRLEAALLDEAHMHGRVFADPGTRAGIAERMGQA